VRSRTKGSDEDWRKLGYTMEGRGEAGRILRPQAHRRRNLESHGSSGVTSHLLSSKEHALEFIRLWPSVALRSYPISQWIKHLILSGDRKTLNQVINAATTQRAKRGRPLKADFFKVGSLHKVLKSALQAHRRREIGADMIIIPRFDFDPVNNQSHKEALGLAVKGRPAMGAMKVVTQYFGISPRTARTLNRQYRQAEEWFKKETRALENALKQGRL